jgi:hypothetical protein
VSFFLWTNEVKTQNRIVVTNVKVKCNKVNFSLSNIGVDNFEFDPVVSYKKDNFIPHYYSYIEDTLEVELQNQDDKIQTSSCGEVEIFIDGERRNTNKIIKPNEKMNFTIIRNKENKFKVVKIIFSDSHILYHIIL